MIYQHIKIAVLFISLLFISSTKQLNVGANELPVTSRAGEEIILQFNDISPKARLFLISPYGKTLLKPQKCEDKTCYKIPEFIANKSGVISWKVEGRQGEILILPNEGPEKIETYFGPRSIQAGDGDFSMLVAIPLDKYDNPLEDGTSVQTQEYYAEVIQKDSLSLKNMIAWKNFPTRDKAGKILLSASSAHVFSKELSSRIYPSVPANFQISVNRIHDYADGNQVATLSTSILKDRFGNIVSDGTLVDFLISTETGKKLKTTASTINGVATAGVLHPEKPNTWKIRAVVNGIADSDLIEIKFKPVLNDFEVIIEPESKSVKVGPLQSFLDQQIPEGTTVTLTILRKNKINFKMQEATKKAYAIFNLPEEQEFLENDIFKVETLGITKSINIP